MRLQLDITPDLVAMMAAAIRAGEKAVSAATRETGNTLKASLRAQITGAGLGQRLARAIRSEQFPKGKPSLNAAALVWSKAPVIVGAHDTGPLIRSKNGFWLAIPTPAAGKSSRGGRITPGEWERRTGLRLRFVYRRMGPSLLVAEGRLNTRGCAVASRSRAGRGVTTVPIFLLVPQVKLPKRLDLARDAERTQEALPARSWQTGWKETSDDPARNHPHRPGGPVGHGAICAGPARRGLARARSPRRSDDPARRRVGRTRRDTFTAALPLPAPR